MEWEVARKYVIPPGIVVVCLILGWICQRLASAALRRSASRRGDRREDIVIRALRGLVFVWFLLAGLAIGLKAAALPPDVLHPLQKAISVAAIFSVVLFFVRLASGFVSHYFDRQTEIPTSIIRNISSAVIYAVGFLVILDFIGVSITPILTALGVGALAVALALQDTLSNLFAGIHILLSKKVRRGDYIKLENGDEGIVSDISWRNVTIQALSNNLIIVPNGKLASSIVTNYHLPDPEVSVLIDVGVSYDSDLGKVERITSEVAAEVLQTTPGAVAGFHPFIRFGKLGESSITFTAILRGSRYTDQYLIRHEFIKKLLERYRAEGIEIPPPTRRVLIENTPASPATAGRGNAR